MENLIWLLSILQLLTHQTQHIDNIMKFDATIIEIEMKLQVIFILSQFLNEKTSDNFFHNRFNRFSMQFFSTIRVNLYLISLDKYDTRINFAPTRTIPTFNLYSFFFLINHNKDNYVIFFIFNLQRQKTRLTAKTYYHSFCKMWHVWR